MSPGIDCLLWLSLGALVLSKAADFATTIRRVGPEAEANPLASSLFRHLGFGGGLVVVAVIWTALVMLAYGVAFGSGIVSCKIATATVGFIVSLAQWDAARLNRTGRASWFTRRALMIYDWMGHRKAYRGAGILFCCGTGAECKLLLVQRRSGTWSIPGGGATAGESDPWDTAVRQSSEELGLPRSCSGPLGRHRFQARILHEVRFQMLLFGWTTFVVDVTGLASPDEYPERMSRDFQAELIDARWVPLSGLPKRVHILLWPVVWKVRRNRAKLASDRHNRSLDAHR